MMVSIPVLGEQGALSILNRVKLFASTMSHCPIIRGGEQRERSLTTTQSKAYPALPAGKMAPIE